MNPDDDRTLLWEGGPPHPHPHPPAKRSGRIRRVLVRAGKVVLGVLAAYYVLAVLLLVVYRFVQPPTTGVQLERRIEALVAGEEYEKRREIVAYDELPRHVPRAVVAAEDGRFWDHFGFDLDAMREAGREAVERGRVRGASTITQQLMKNLFGCTCRNPVRKVYDLALTPAAELILGKERILELYLNNVEWGEGVFGVEAAARHHYDTSAEKLSRTQAAGLAALLPNPLRRTPENTGQYRREILRRMRHRGW
ncbi:MAG TPA: monofunctional biosynthetic peptidoglycan transglycosylase [Longimicrobiaceae bacterium]|nr:monofunctional biosynthetic peptidoglycan transglycosylase [Longimicrobiaceae bacterium]